MTRTYLQTVFSQLKCATQKTRAELLGLVQGVLADGAILESEAAFIHRWIDDNHAIRDTWPANVLYARIGAMLSDGVLEAEEQRELLETLLKFVHCREAARTSCRGWKVHFVVVGSLGNELWKGGDYRKKIERRSNCVATGSPSAS